jgi:hypothetical protein
MYTTEHYHHKKDINTCSQDGQQKMFVILVFFIELYRVVIGTCLITFVPQICDNVNCGYIWFVSGKTLFDIAYYINIGTLFSFLILFCIEIIRENKIITYLEVNDLIGTDNDEVGKIIENLNPIKRKSLYWIDTVYVSWSIYCLACFSTNTIVSGIVIIRHLDSKTISSFMTNILFMITKLSRIYFIINTKKNVFYSAYLIHFVQFNDLDPKEIEWIESQKMNEDIFEDDWISIKIENKEDIFEKDWVSKKIDISI